MPIVQLPDPKKFRCRLRDKYTQLISLKNRNGMQVALTDYGARIVSVLVPQKSGKLADVALGFADIQSYLQPDEQCHGATVGRFANRIAGGTFRLDGNAYTLTQNNGRNCLHGGPDGFHRKIWDSRVLSEQKVEFHLVSPDGEAGFPGRLEVAVSYELTEDNRIAIRYEAETDRKTPINLTNHTYFNLNGEGRGDILGHTLHLPADRYLPVDENLIPTGLEAPVENTAFDFRMPKKIGAAIHSTEHQIRIGNGFDHTFVNSQPLSLPAATVLSEASGIRLDVFTTEPGLQFYTGNFLNGNHTGKSGNRYLPRAGFCLETQHYPDSPNQPQFPSTVLSPGEIFRSETVYQLKVENPPIPQRGNY